MAIEYVYGDILRAGASFGVQAVVNPVNCKGVMGKGLALQFRKAYPAMYREYQAMCQRGWFKPGELYLYLVPGATLPRYIACVATKDHWQQASSHEIVQMCVLNLYNVIVKYRLQSIAIPALGCGEGRLSWPVVQDLIYEGLKCFDAVQILVYPPHAGVDVAPGAGRPPHSVHA